MEKTNNPVPQEPEDLSALIAEAKKRMEKISVRWYVDDPILLSAYCLLDKIPDARIDTIGIDARCNPPNLRFNPKFIKALTDERLEFVMVSEMFKVLLRHPTTRLKSPRFASNLASTISVNEVMTPKFPFINNNNNTPQSNEWGFEENKWYEYYFQKIMENLPKTMAQAIQQFGVPPEERRQQEQQGQGGKNFKDENEAIKEYQNPFGNSNNNWANNDMFDADVKNMVNEKKSSARNWGKYTNNAMGEIVAANTSKISYKDIIKRFNASILSTRSHSSRMKVSRRYDLAAPGQRREYKANLIFAIDTSGSMTDDDLREAFAVINSACKHCNIEYVLFDTEIKMVEKKFRRAKQSFKVLGRGGTDFNEVLKYAEKSKADGIVIYTDGQAAKPQKPKNTKVLWLMTLKEYHPPVDWGMVAYLDRNENVH